MDPIETIKAHVPSLSKENEREIIVAQYSSDDVADLAIRTCSCGERIDGFYAYVDHLITVFGDEE